ncbi:hypothetical protein ABPG75_003805 [Micractinium tetrahymenae]
MAVRWQAGPWGLLLLLLTLEIGISAADHHLQDLQTSRQIDGPAASRNALRLTDNGPGQGGGGADPCASVRCGPAHVCKALGNTPVCLVVCGQQVCQQHQSLAPAPKPLASSTQPFASSAQPLASSAQPISPTTPCQIGSNIGACFTPAQPSCLFPTRTATDTEYAQLPLVIDKYVASLNCTGNAGAAADADTGAECFTIPATSKTCCTYAFDQAVPKRPVNFAARFTGSVYAPDSATCEVLQGG